MSKEREAQLAQLARINERRQEARRRDLARQQRQLDQAERELQAQREREAAAAARLAQVVRRTGDELQQGCFTAGDALRLQGYLSVQRSLAQAEATASDAARSIVQVAQGDVDQARDQLTEARTAHEKAKTMHARVAQKLQRDDEARREIDVDGLNMDAHARRSGPA